jgi:hypothetical protein
MSIYLSFRGENEYILIFPGEKLVYTHFSGGKMSRGKNEYVTPALIRIWNKIPQEFFNTLIRSMRLRCQACMINANGGHIRY